MYVDKSTVGRLGQTVHLNPQNVTLVEVVACTRNSTLGMAASLKVHSNDRRTSQVNSKKKHY